MLHWDEEAFRSLRTCSSFSPALSPGFVQNSVHQLLSAPECPPSLRQSQTPPLSDKPLGTLQMSPASVLGALGRASACKALYSLLAPSTRPGSLTQRHTADRAQLRGVSLTATDTLVPAPMPQPSPSLLDLVLCVVAGSASSSLPPPPHALEKRNHTEAESRF